MSNYNDVLILIEGIAIGWTLGSLFMCIYVDYFIINKNKEKK